MPDETENKSVPLSPMAYLATIPGAPTEAQLTLIKAQAPGGRVRLFTSSDGKRVYIMRGFSGLELKAIQGRIPAGISPQNYPEELQKAIAVACCVWTNAGQDGKLTDAILHGSSGAGLAIALHEVAAMLSDYMSPEQIEQYSADL